MKTVIGCLNSKYIHASLSPWCLLAGVKSFAQKEHQVTVMESTINGSLSDYAEKIILLNPKAVAFSCYIWNITHTLQVCEIIKKRLNCTVILGGPEVAYCSAEMLKKYDFIDLILSGEGEYNFPKLLDLLDKKDFETVEGLSYRKGDKIFINPPENHFDTPPSPYCKEFFENLKGRICYTETSRGCPYRCAFCLSGNCSPLRFFDMERVKNDILSLSRSDTQTIKFVDRTFNANEKRANEILQFILENRGEKIPENICFHFEIAGDILKPSTINLLKKFPTGSVQLEIGMQSFNKEVLKNINRKTDTEKLINNIKTLVAMGNMHIHIDLIAGLTGETFESFRRSFDIGYSLNANMLQLGFLKLLHGADMREDREKYPCTFSDDPPYEVIETPWITADELHKITLCEDALERTYNSGRFINTLKFLGVGDSVSPFDFFCSLGEKVRGEKMPLAKYAEELFKTFEKNCDPQSLREAIISDLIASGCALQIPEILKIKDPRFSKIKRSLATKNSRLKFAILYSKNQVMVCDYNQTPDLHGRFEVKYYPLELFETK